MTFSKDSLSVSIKTLLQLLKKPIFLINSFIIAVLLFVVFRFFFEGGVLVGIVFSNALTFFEKLAFVVLGFIPSTFTEAADILFTPFSLTLILLSVIQGFAIAAYIKIASQRLSGSERLSLKSVGLALFGSGCVACGTSLIAPLFAGAGVTTATFFSQLIGNTVLFIAVLVAFYGLHKILLVEANVTAKAKRL